MLVLYKLRMIGVAGTFILSKIIEEPLCFYSQVVEALRMRNNFFPPSLLERLTVKRTCSTPDRCALLFGDFGVVISRYWRSGKLGKLLNFGLYLSAKRSIDKLKAPIPESTDWERKDAVRVLYFVNNSAPCTRSGYTVRTKEIVDSIEPSVEKILTVTRLGYPVVIGRFSLPGCAEYNKVIMPWYLPYKEQDRRKLAVSMLVSVCKKEKITILHTTTNYNNAQVIAAVAKELQLPWVYEVRGEPHNTWLSKFDPEQREVAKASIYYRYSVENEIEACLKASAVVVLSQLSKNKLIDQGIEAKKITVLPNSVSKDFRADYAAAEDLREQFSLGDGPLVGTISSLVAYEGIEYLIRAIDFMPESVTVVLVGDGEDSGRLRKIAAECLGVRRVRFLGHRPAEEMAGWYTLLDVFVVPRVDSEVCRNVTPLKPLQSLAVGTPIVASDLPALREVTGGFAVFVTPQNPAELAREITKILGDSSAVIPDPQWLESRKWKYNGEKLSSLYEGLTQRKGEY